MTHSKFVDLTPAGVFAMQYLFALLWKLFSIHSI